MARRGPTVRPSSLNPHLHGSGHTIGSTGRSRVNEAGGRRTCRVAPRSTGERVTVAWHHARPLERHSLIAACITSIALVISLRPDAIVAGANAIVGVLLATAALVDTHERRLPNRLLVHAFGLSIFGSLVSFDGAVIAASFLGLILSGGLMLSVRLTRGVGMGDVKMAAVVGASVGASTASLFASAIAVAVAATAAAAYGLVANRKRVPLGPSLWFGWAATLALVALVGAIGGAS